MAKSDFVYAIASTNINQSTPNYVKTYLTIKSVMIYITDLIGPELYELFALELANIAESDFVYTLASAISTKLGHNIFAHKVSDEFDYWTNQTRIWLQCI